MKAISADTTVEMTTHVAPFVTPISEEIEDGTGDHLGTGSYVRCEHNGRRLDGNACCDANELASADAPVLGQR